MANVKILLRENVADLGTLGDIVEVTPGYARNYLLPKRLAVEASSENMRVMERRRARYEADMVQQEKDVGVRIQALGNLQLVTRQKADDSGSLYGSVNAAMVAQLLADAGHKVGEKAVRLEEPIKSVGNHEIPIHVHGEHYAGVVLLVEAEV